MRLATYTLMLPRNQDFEERSLNSHVFSRIPMHVCASQDDGRKYVPSLGDRAPFARAAGSKQLQLRAIAKAVVAQRPKPENSGPGALALHGYSMTSSARETSGGGTSSPRLSGKAETKPSQCVA